MLRKTEDTALYELDSRIAAMERRLKNAKAARDSYLTFLKQKYPAWKPTFSANYNADPGRSLVGDLSTSNYHWDVGIEKRRAKFRPLTKIPEKLYSQIPQEGPYLDSDLKRVRERLEEISSQLRLIRDTRLNLSTEDYVKTRLMLEENAEPSFELETSNLTNLRLRLENLNNSDLYEPVETPTKEKIEDLKMEQLHEQYIDDIKSGKIQPSYLLPSSKLALSEQPERDTVILREPPQNQSTPKVDDFIQPRRTISFANQKQEEPKKLENNVNEEKQNSMEEVSKTTTSTYAQLLGLFGKTSSKKMEDSDSDEISIKPPTKEAENKPKPYSGDTLSKYLSKIDDSSDSDDVVLKKSHPAAISQQKSMTFQIQQPPASTSLSKSMADADSDSDFFG